MGANHSKGKEKSKEGGGETNVHSAPLIYTKAEIAQALTEAKEVFYKGNDAFRQAKFDEARQMYFQSLEKLRQWNEMMHPHPNLGDLLSPPHSTEAIKPIQPPQLPQSTHHPASLTLPEQQSDPVEVADKENSPVPHPNLSLAEPTSRPASYETAAMMNLGLLQFIDGCHKDSVDLLHKALEKHRQYSHPFYAGREERQRERMNSIHSAPNTTTATGGGESRRFSISSAASETTAVEEATSPSLTSLSVLIKRDLSLMKAHANERVLVSKLHEFSTLDAMIADLLNNLAACYEVMGELEMAKTLFLESLDLRVVVYGKQSLKAAETMQNLATILDALGDTHKAEEYLTEALEIEKKELGEGHIETAITMNNLGVLLAHMEQYDRAEALLERSIELRESYYGSQHHLTVCAKQNLEYIHQQAANQKKGKEEDEEDLSTNLSTQKLEEKKEEEFSTPLTNEE